MKPKYTLYSTCCYVPAYNLDKFPGTHARVIAEGATTLDGKAVTASTKIVCPRCSKPFTPSRANIKAN